MHKALIYFLAMIVYCEFSAVSMKTEYVIGGWGPAEWSILYTKWQPIFEIYLTETVGRHYDPPISFKLVAVDQTEESSTGEMISAGKIDFLCEWLDLFSCRKSTELLILRHADSQIILRAPLRARRLNSGACA